MGEYGSHPCALKTFLKRLVAFLLQGNIGVSCELLTRDNRITIEIR